MWIIKVKDRMGPVFYYLLVVLKIGMRFLADQALHAILDFPFFGECLYPNKCKLTLYLTVSTKIGIGSHVYLLSPPPVLYTFFGKKSKFL
jgi:hypothetical protein